MHAYWPMVNKLHVGLLDGLKNYLYEFLGEASK